MWSYWRTGEMARWDGCWLVFSEGMNSKLCVFIVLCGDEFTVHYKDPLVTRKTECQKDFWTLLIWVSQIFQWKLSFSNENGQWWIELLVIYAAHARWIKLIRNPEVRLTPLRPKSETQNTRLWNQNSQFSIMAGQPTPRNVPPPEIRVYIIRPY